MAHNEECGYCGTASDPNLICRKCWDEMVARGHAERETQNVDADWCTTHLFVVGGVWHALKQLFARTPSQASGDDGPK